MRPSFENSESRRWVHQLSRASLPNGRSTRSRHHQSPRRNNRKYLAIASVDSILILSRPVFTRAFGRISESEEDDSYFQSGDDDDSQIVPVPVAEPGVGLGAFARRKRPRGTAIIGQPNRSAMRPMNVPSQQRPQSPLSSLLEYDEDDDITSPRTEPPNPLLAGRLPDQNPSSPQSPVLQHRQIEILPYEPSSDPEDDILESLVSNNAKKGDALVPASKAALTARSTSEGLKPREKRRRPEEEDDDMLERLTPKNRRLSNSNSSDTPSPEIKDRVVTVKSSDEGPRKLKLKFTNFASKPALQPVIVPPSTDAKDGDNG